jgi:hypothetical protein
MGRVMSIFAVSNRSGWAERVSPYSFSKDFSCTKMIYNIDKSFLHIQRVLGLFSTTSLTR